MKKKKKIQPKNITTNKMQVVAEIFVFSALLSGQWITENIKIRQWGIMNVCTKFHGNQSVDLKNQIASSSR